MNTTSRTFTDTFCDDMRVQLDGGKLHIKAVQKFRHSESKETNMSFSPSQAEEIRDHLIRLFPLPAITAGVELQSVGELTSISTEGGSIVIHATGNVIINQK